MHPSPFPRILVFDSGIGGMGIVRALREKSSALTIDYLADNALFPYGEQPDDLLINRVVSLITQACHILQPDLVIIACNTASTLVLPALRAVLQQPVVGCVPPIRWAGRVSQTRTIGLLATKATARRIYVTDLHQQFAPDCRLIIHGSSKLAECAELAFRGEKFSAQDVLNEVEQLFSQPGGHSIDTIGLGCTHYTFLMPTFQLLEKQNTVTWLDPAPAVADYVLQRLTESPLSHPPSEELRLSPQRFFATATPKNSDDLIQHISWLGFSRWELFHTPIPTTQDAQLARLTV